MIRFVLSFTAAVLLLAATAQARQWHVALAGRDDAAGTAAAPLRHIQRAAELAQPGDTITIHAGVYRERVNPPRGGESAERRIVYEAAGGEKVVIAGSEVVKGWTKVQNDTWRTELPATFFGGFNPYADEIRGDWFNPLGRKHHTGAVYVNGHWLVEAAKLDDVLAPFGAQRPAFLQPADPAVGLWFATVDPQKTTLWAQFPGIDPNAGQVEINVRRTVFYPDKPGRNFITVRGLTLRHAATNWAPPTAEQVGLVGTHWSKGWIIENNSVSHSVCAGIALGKHGDAFDNTSADTAEGYVKTIERAHAHAIPWTRDNIGGHVVRNNTVAHCEQAGIVGSLCPAFSTVVDNTIHDIHVRRLFTGAEQAGIKFHAAIDTLIARNYIHHTCRGLWLDWMAQGTRVTANLFHDNLQQDLFVEVNHGPFVIDNNIFLSSASLLDMSQGGAYLHNLFGGKLVSSREPGRETPYHPPHSTAVAGLKNIAGGDDRFYNNVFLGGDASRLPARPKKDDWHRRTTGYGLTVYDASEPPLLTGGNVYLNGAKPHAHEADARVEPAAVEPPRLVAAEGETRLTLRLPAGVNERARGAITTASLGATRVAGLPYLNPDGTPLAIDRDYFGRPRNVDRPTPGPFEDAAAAATGAKVR